MHLLGKVLDGALAQSKLASVFDKNGKGVRWPPPRSSVFDKNGKGVANEPLAIEGVAKEKVTIKKHTW